MVTIKKTLSETDLTVLKSLIGKKLNKIVHDEFIYNDSVYMKVCFFIDNQIYKLVNDLETINYYGSNEDISFIKFSDCSAEDVCSEVVDMKQIETIFDKEIQNVIIVNEKQKVKNEKESYDFTFTQGIVFDLGDSQIGFEKLSDFSEEICIYKCSNAIKKFSSVDDFSDDFDEGIKANAERELVFLRKKI